MKDGSEGYVKDEDADADAKFALAMVPIGKEVMDRVRGMLPDGTHFGVFILTPPHKGEGRVIALTTDRDVMAPQVAQWVIEILQRKAGG